MIPTQQNSLNVLLVNVFLDITVALPVGWLIP